MYQSKTSNKGPFLAGATTQSTMSANTANVKGKLQSLEVRALVCSPLVAGNDPQPR